MNNNCLFKNPSFTFDLSGVTYAELTLYQLWNTQLIKKTEKIISYYNPRLITPAVKKGRENYLRELLLNRGDILVELDNRADNIADEILYRDIHPILKQQP